MILYLSQFKSAADILTQQGVHLDPASPYDVALVRRRYERLEVEFHDNREFKRISIPVSLLGAKDTVTSGDTVITASDILLFDLVLGTRRLDSGECIDAIVSITSMKKIGAVSFNRTA